MSYPFRSLVSTSDVNVIPFATYVYNDARRISFYNDDGYSLLDYNGEKISYGLHVYMPSSLVTGYLYLYLHIIDTYNMLYLRKYIEK